MGIFGSGLGLPLGVAQAAAKPLAKSGATFGLAGMIGGSPMQRLGGLAGEALNINPKLAALSQIFGSLVGKESPVFGMWAMQEQQRRAAEQAQANREADYTDFQRRYDYERANPKPATAQPYRWESNDGDVYQLGPDGQPQRIFDDPTPRMNFIPDGMGGGQWVPMPGMAAPSGPVGQLTPVGKLTPITGGAPQAPRPFANPPARGLRQSGNIDLNNRPIVPNRDGTISTVRSMSIGTDQGEVLIPTVSEDGRIMSDDEAVAQYLKTGKHLGIFDTPDAATTYAKALHNQQAQQYGGKRFANPPMRLKHGAMTSGRRTAEGNKLVGGVDGSKHLTGEAGDWSGPDLNALLAEVRTLPGLRKAFIHKGNHVHAEGNWNVPYFGKRGTIGKR